MPLPWRRMALRIVRCRSRLNGSPNSYGLALVAALVADADGRDLVLAHLVLGQLGEQVRQRVLPDPADALRRQLEATLPVLDQPGLLQHAGQLGQALERAGGVVAQQVPHPVEVGLGQRAGARRRRASGSPAGRCRRAAASCRRPRRSPADPCPGSCRTGPNPSGGTCDRRCWPSWSICQRRSMSSSSWSMSCWSCARCSGVIELSMACMAAIRWAMTSSSSSSDCGFSGKKSPKRSMNCSNPGSSPRSRRSSISLRPASMSLMRCICSGVMFSIARGHLVDVALHELLAELVEQLLEALRRLLRGELVALELADLAGQVGREHVELHVVLAGRGLGQLLAPRVAAVARLADVVVQATGAPGR